MIARPDSPFVGWLRQPVSPAGRFELSPGHVHVWCAALDVPPAMAARCYPTLSADERDRTARLRVDREQQRFIVAHGALRDVLARYLDTTPSEIRFAHGAHGRPELAPGLGGRLRFNLTHSAGLALIAVAVEVDVGVDVECVRAHRDYGEIARWFFSTADIDHLATVPMHLHAEAFARCWTRREAYLKARGDGFAAPPDELPVPPASSESAGDVVDTGGWSFHTLRPAPGYIGALAIQGSDWRLSQWRWELDLPD